jgi:hypothetical protein
MRTTLRFVVGGALVLMTACATTTDATKAITERAAFDLDCPADQLEIVPLPGGAHGVRGCGLRATYVFAEPECRSARTMPRGDFRSSCTPLLDFKSHDKAQLEQNKAHEHHEKAYKEEAREHHDEAGDKAEDKAGVESGD